MQQIILLKPGSIELRDVPLPGPADGEVLVKVHTALTCGTDLKAYARGHKLVPMPGPFGHEYSGTIAGTGKGVKDFREGDDVMGVHTAPCLACGYCRKGLHNLCERIMEEKVLGAFSGYLLLPPRVVEQNLFHKPASLSFEQAALLEPLSCIIHPYSKLQVHETDTAVVLGAGPIGLMHLVYLERMGIRVIISDYSDDRRSAASEMGAFRTALPEDIEDVLREATGGLGADLVIECTGQQTVWEKSVTYARRGGTIVLFGGCPSGTDVSFDTSRLHYDELTLMGSFHFTPKDVRTAYQLLTAGEIELSRLISGSFPLKDVGKALSLLKEGRGIKYAINPLK